jgi:hypothetical protein
MPKYKIKKHSEYFCDVNGCLYKTRNKSNLLSHRSRKHDINITWYHCDICTIYRAKSKGDLKQHKQNVHDVEVKWKYCDRCEYKTKKTSHLKRHQFTKHKVVNGELPNYLMPFSCELCDHKCTGKQNMIMHKKYIHSIDVKYFSCINCQKKFKQKSHLTRHMKSKHEDTIFI